VSTVSLDEVTVELGGARIVDALSASVAAGEWVCLIGPNGAGKTTLLRAIAGLLPYAGSISLAGRDAGTLGRRELAREVAFVPQVPALPPEMTVIEYVLLGRTPHLGYLGTEGRRDRAAAERALLRLDLTELAFRPLGSLSGGERQRAVLARALAQETPLLLLDEPTAALDVGRQQQALELVDALRRDEGLTVLSAMHDLTLAGQYAERLLLLSRAQLVASGAPGEVLTEQLIAAHYAASVRILALGSAGVVVVPERSGEHAAGCELEASRG
jgi:iron complex transport system ATP-binding protein